MAKNGLKEMWKLAAADLNINVSFDHVLHLKEGASIRAEVLVRDFGAANGMLIFCSYDQLADYDSEIIDAGYGYSIMCIPAKDECYQRKPMIELLEDWGWTGNEQGRPRWAGAGCPQNIQNLNK